MVVIRQIDGKGRGVFTLQALAEGDLVERAPVVVVSAADFGHIEKTILNEYYYDWDNSKGTRAIVLGCGSLYNHSYEPNARYLRRFDEQEMDYIALRPIAEREEVCVNYNGIINDMSDVWFHVVR